jgi:hypothetical protein
VLKYIPLSKVILADIAALPNKSVYAASEKEKLQKNSLCFISNESLQKWQKWTTLI